MTLPQHDYLQEIALAARKHTASTALHHARSLFRKALRTPRLAPDEGLGVRHLVVTRAGLDDHLDTITPSGLLH
jgi:hypothetical protein